MTAPLLDVRDLSVEFPLRRQRLQALDGISFSLEAGEVLGFVGESGAGKSLTGAAIMGLLEPPGRITAGTIALQGRRIEDDAASVRGGEIGMIFQDPLTSLNPLRTVGDQLVETIQLHLGLSGEAAEARAIELLEEVGIDHERRSAFPHEFSGGMRQRIVIALALAPEPKLIIADEPTTALDVSIQAQVLALLRRLCKERGAAVILITHAMGVIGETTWFYSQYRVRSYAWRAPEIVSRDIVAVSFADNGTVSNVETYTLADGQIVDISRRVTESSIREVSIFRQVMGNFGRINVGELVNANN